MKKLLMTCAASTLIMTSSMAKADMQSSIMNWFEETEIAANVRLANDYQFYGASQTSGSNGVDNGISIQGGFDLTWGTIDFLGGDLYSGLFAANVEWSRTKDVANVADYSSLEFTHYHGIAGDSVFGTGISWDVGGIQYTYPNQSSDAGAVDDFDYWEIYGMFGYSFDDVMLSPAISAGVYYSPAWFGYDESSYHIPVGLDLSLPYDFGLSFFFGHLDVDFTTAQLAANGNVDNYQYYGVTLSRSALGLDWDIGYTGISDDDDCAAVQFGSTDSSQCGGWIFGMSKSF